MNKIVTEENLKEIEAAAELTKRAAYNLGFPQNKIRAIEAKAIGTTAALIAERSK